MTIPAILAHYRAQLQSYEQLADHSLNGGFASALQVIGPQLERLYQQIAAKQQSGEDIPVSWLYEQRRLQALTALIEGQINHYAALSQATVGHMQQQGLLLGQQSAQQQLQATVPPGVHWTFGIPHPGAIANIVSSTERLFSGMGTEAATAAKNALIRAITLGENPQAVARDLQQALQIARYRVLTIARTEMLNAYRGAQLANYQANSDVVGGWVWSAALFPRTCAACIAMNGTVHDVSEPFASHPNCRCSPVPKTNSWASILGPLGIDTSNIPETSVNIPSGVSWFNDQSAATQLAILGPGKYAAFQNGTLNLSDLVGYSDGGVYEKSLKELGV